jgi:hypothetical protein
VIGVLQTTGGITEHLRDIIAMMNKDTGALVCYNTDPDGLLDQLEEIYVRVIKPRYLKVTEDADPDGELSPF